MPIKLDNITCKDISIAGKVISVDSTGITLDGTTVASSNGSSNVVSTVISKPNHGLSVGDWVTSTLVKAQANDDTKLDVVGIVVEASTNSFTICTNGHLKNLSIINVGTVGTTLYLNDNGKTAVSAGTNSLVVGVKTDLGMIVKIGSRVVVTNNNTTTTTSTEPTTNTTNNNTNIISGDLIGTTRNVNIMSEYDPASEIIIRENDTYLIANYTKLFAMFGSTFGGDGLSTFMLPKWSAWTSAPSKGGLSSTVTTTSTNTLAYSAQTGGYITFQDVKGNYTKDQSIGAVAPRTSGVVYISCTGTYEAPSAVLTTNSTLIQTYKGVETCPYITSQSATSTLIYDGQSSCIAVSRAVNSVYNGQHAAIFIRKYTTDSLPSFTLITENSTTWSPMTSMNYFFPGIKTGAIVKCSSDPMTTDIWVFIKSIDAGVTTHMLLQIDMNSARTTYSSSAINISYNMYGIPSLDLNRETISIVGSKLFRIKLVTCTQRPDGLYDFKYEASYHTIDETTQTLGAKTLITTKTYAGISNNAANYDTYGNSFFAQRFVWGSTYQKDWEVLGVYAYLCGWFTFDTITGTFGDFYGDGAAMYHMTGKDVMHTRVGKAPASISLKFATSGTNYSCYIRGLTSDNPNKAIKYK